MLSILKNQTALGILLHLLLKEIWKWKMVIDLRAVNKVIQSMGSLQSGIPLPSLLSKGLFLIVDLKDSFFTIPLQKKRKKDSEKFAFTVPT